MSINPNDPTSGCDDASDPLAQPSRMLALFNVAHPQSAQQTTWLSTELGEILAHQLEVPLREIGIPDARGEATVGKLLDNPAPSVAALEQLKGIFKGASLSDAGGLPKEVATVLYLAVIVAARRVGQTLTKLDDAAMRERIDWALARRWLDPALRKLFLENLDQPRAGS